MFVVTLLMGFLSVRIGNNKSNKSENKEETI
jgi:hypothetical protein